MLAPVTLEEMLKQTNGLPDYTKHPTFVQQSSPTPNSHSVRSS